MADIKEEQHPAGHEHDADILLKAKSYWDKYSKPVGTAVAVIVVIVVGWYSYINYIVNPNEDKAAVAMYTAEGYFRQDSLKLALSGDGYHKGFVYIINNFGGTKAGNLAKYYAGLSYLRTGDFKNAVKYLKDFSTGAKQIQMLAYGALGDAYSELGNKEDAVTNYEKASETFPDDELNASEYLFRAALRSEIDGKTQHAVELYKKLKDEFPNTQHGKDADKYIHRLSDETGLTTK